MENAVQKSEKGYDYRASKYKSLINEIDIY
jgi:hypothetical protein